MSDHEVVNQWLDPQKVRALAEGLLVPVPRTDFTPDESFFGDSFEGFTDHPIETPEKKVVIHEEKGTSKEAPLVVPVVKRDPVAPPPNRDRPIQSDPFRKIEASAAPPEEPAKAVRQIKPLPLAQPAAQLPPTIEKTESPGRDDLPSPFRALPKQVEAPAFQPANDKAIPEDRDPVAASRYGDLKPFINWLKKQNPIHSSFICNQEGHVVFDEVGDAKLRKVGRSLGLAANPPERRGESDSSKNFTRVRIAEDRFMEILPLDSPSGLLIVGLMVERPLSGPALDIVVRTFHASFARSSSSGQ